MEQNPTIMVERADEKRRTGLAAGVVGIALVAALGVGGTLAYLTYTTNQEMNRFTTNPNITADLLEPEWSSAALATDHATSPDNQAMPKAADNMIPGCEVSKNPFVVNTSVNKAKAWAGIKLQFEKWDSTQGANGEYVPMSNNDVDKVLKVYSLYAASKVSPTGGPSAGILMGDGWIESVKHAENGAKYYYYNTALEAETADEHAAENTSNATLDIPAAKRTTCLFDKVKFLESATQTDIDALNTVLGSNNPSWRVTVTGAVIGATGAQNETAATFVDDTHGVSWKAVLDGAQASTTAGTGVRA